MTYFADLSPYTYFRLGKADPARNVGWLDAAHPYETGAVDAEIVARLVQITCYCVNQSRGLYICNFCNSDSSLIYKLNEKNLLLGGSEIRVFSPDGAVFSAPTLLLHYIKVHNYRPPRPFLDAVRNGPVPPMKGYFDLLNAHQYEWDETLTHDGQFNLRLPMEPPSWLKKR